MTEQVRRLLTNAVLIGAAAFAGAIATSEGGITFAVVAAAVAAGGFAALAVIAKLSGFVTPGNPYVVNALLAGVAAGAAALAASGEFTEAALVAAGGAAIRGAAGVSFSVSDHPQPE